MDPRRRPSNDIPSILARIDRPSRAVVTAGMPYANGKLHLGHLAGAFVPGDIHARWLGMLIGRENVMFVCGTDDHGSTSDVAARAAGQSVRAFIDGIHVEQRAILERYQIDLDTYTGTSRPGTYERQVARCQDMLRTLRDNGLLPVRTTAQWYDPVAERFLPDRLVRGTCPNPKCGNPEAYGDECSKCGHQHEPDALLEPRSTLSDATPELRDTAHGFLDMYSVSETLRTWIQSKKKSWRPAVLGVVLGTVMPALRVAAEDDAAYKEVRAQLPKHKKQFAPGRILVLQFADKPSLAAAQATLAEAHITTELDDAWGHRSITRDVDWGIPVPDDLDPQLTGKTLYVWPDSLIAPISFTETALVEAGRDPSEVDAFWKDPKARVYQFLGQDNVFFYVLLQGALWLGTQDDPHRMPVEGELQMTEIFGCFHLLVGGEKMSKSTGNFVNAIDLLEQGYDADQIRYYLALMGLASKQSSFDFDALKERNRFLAGPMNAAFERCISAAHSKFDGVIPEGELLEEVKKDTEKIVARYTHAMQKADYHALLYDVENYARRINKLFARYKPHDDRHPEQGRRDALFSCFAVLKTLMIMLYPFTPSTMERLRVALRLPQDVFSVDQLGTTIPAGHAVGPNGSYYPHAPEE
jgi:methionyl-tRNA synthetase